LPIGGIVTRDILSATKAPFMKRIPELLLALLFVCFQTNGSLDGIEPGGKPNVLLIYTDDQGGSQPVNSPCFSKNMACLFHKHEFQLSERFGHIPTLWRAWLREMVC